ncbi:50S ribosomal protein L7/L12 [Cucumis melo var. makuwa]|uniref:50S ribosomal protein L7/L12 n=1 Tax=Cucumis melo var. makuwa TaxID=1194695 RepID=A0A5A7SU77_CUCMM|nr:50S ribosomal protein L7/L12 [Cucumis melo var. makuwa]TYK15722.1 50S ribosomal protein L7/L12 [Cucumis melo var. makuwa]
MSVARSVRHSLKDLDILSSSQFQWMAWTLVPKVEGGGAAAGSSKAEEKEEKTAFDVKLEKFDSASKIKVIKEVRSFTNLGLKEAKDLVEKVPAILKQGVTKEEANDIIEKIKAAGGVAVMEVVKCSKPVELGKG